MGLRPPEDLEPPEQVRWCWESWHKANTLVVLDDVKDYSEIKPYLPPQLPQFKVLITTRLRLDFTGSLYMEDLPQPDAFLILTLMTPPLWLTVNARMKNEFEKKFN
ncbi:hypothetical protein [Aetokthonos hydrillicola]|uniref:hypothetical protein n=1 Tax=Aetokthonos hydrillicola TaxID=1550245 RepID=UPI001ABBD702